MEKSLLGVFKNIVVILTFLYKMDVVFVLTELKGYHVTTGEPVCQPRRPNSRIDKVRYMFNKIT